MFRLDRFLTLHIIYPFLKRSIGYKDAKLPILMYHSVSEDSEEGIPAYYRVSTPPDLFRAQMKWLHENGYKTIDLSQALDWLDDPTIGKDRCVVLTFDDGFKDFITHAWPVLEEFGQTATVFLPTNFIGKNRRSFKGRECLTWSEVQNLLGSGISFGSHTLSHAILHGAPWKTIRQELGHSRKTIDEMLGTSVEWFSYPYAFPQEDHGFVSRLREELVAQGYRASVTTAIGRAVRNSDPMRLRRLPINSGDDLGFFKAKIAGAYDWMASVQSIIRVAKSTISRRIKAH